MTATTRGLTSITAYSVESGDSANWTLQPPSTPSARMIARAALRRRWWTASVSVWTGATTIESPVWTPSGSTFSIEHTAMHVSSASRITSYSISCQPTRHFSTMTWPMGLARSPARIALAVGRLGLDDAAAGPAEGERRPDDRREADRRERLVRRAVARRLGRALDDQAGRVRLADPVEQVAERLPVLGHADRLERRAREAGSRAARRRRRRPSRRSG